MTWEMPIFDDVVDEVANFDDISYDMLDYMEKYR